MQKALALAILAVPADGTALRLRGEPAKPADIKNKWDKMDGFLEVMFTMACKWKNGKDVFGQGAAALKDGEVEGAAGYQAYVKDLQARNVKGLQKSCGLIIAESKKSCRDGCAASWNALAAKRDECDEKCEKVYSNFERSCASKVDNLAKVYSQNSAMAEAQQQCYRGHCGKFPMVWMKEDEKAMTDEVKEQCEKRCTEKNIKIGCQEKWAAEIDFVTSDVNSKCAEESGVSKCLDGKKSGVSSEYDKCKSDTEKTCGDEFKTCTDKGNADKNFKDAKAFCTDRKKMCLEQSADKCLKENKAALKEAEADCKKDAAKELQTCQDDELEKREKAAEKKCIDKRTPTCKKDCNASCEVNKMNTCLAKLKTKDDPGKLFCKDFWSMLHSSAEVDPVTGMPVAL